MARLEKAKKRDCPALGSLAFGMNPGKWREAQDGSESGGGGREWVDIYK